MDDLKLIKRHYGEKMMHLCRELFPTILERPGVLYTILRRKFAPTRYLYDDLVENKQEDEFKTLIYSMADSIKQQSKSNHKTPKELLDEAGYILYECHSEEEIQAFRKYYKVGEELCTFNGGRLDRCHVFFAIKKNVDEIKRENFPEPNRQDEYGTSVISIQFARGKSNTLSIKNRYNHTVSNPDATFSNNLDNIIEGLTDAFEETYGLDITGKYGNLRLPGYVLANDDRYYKYNKEINNIYYCPDNIIIDNFEVKEFDKSRYIIVDYFVIDLKEKTIEAYDKDMQEDSFLDGLKYIRSIKIETSKETNDKTLIINDDIIIVLNQKNQIKSYTNPHLTKIGNFFLAAANGVESINLPNVESIGDSFITDNHILEEVNLPKVKSIGKSFLFCNRKLKKLILPECEFIDYRALPNDCELIEIYLPKCKSIGNDCFYNADVTEFILPKCEVIGSSVLRKAEALNKLYLPVCREIGSYFLEYNKKLEEVDLPEVITIKDDFIRYNHAIAHINLPKCKTIGNKFLSGNINITELNLPEVEKIGHYFLHANLNLKKFALPKCKSIGNECLCSNNSVEEVDLPEVEGIEDFFLMTNRIIKKVNIPKCKYIGTNFLRSNEELKELDLSSVKHVGICEMRDTLTSLMFIYNENIKVITKNNKDKSK